MAERQEKARLEEARSVEHAWQEEAKREAAVRAEAERLAQAAQQVEELALKEVAVQGHQRALEASRLLKAAHDIEHAKVVQEAADRAELLRREEVLLASRKEAPSLAVALVVAPKLAQEALAA